MHQGSMLSQPQQAAHRSHAQPRCLIKSDQLNGTFYFLLSPLSAYVGTCFFRYHDSMSAEPRTISQMRKRSRPDDLDGVIDCSERQHLNLSQLKAPQTEDTTVSQEEDVPVLPRSNTKNLIACQIELSNTDEERFVHQPLQLDCPSIRLVQVLAPDSDGFIHCAIRHATLEVPPSYNSLTDLPIAGPYTCLSYVWGPPDKSRLIMLNGKPYPVRINLWDFLSVASSIPGDSYKRSRSGFWYQSLWIDAHCIDQGNSQERNHQVQQMGRIYSSATGVVAWMGVNPNLANLLKSIHEKSETQLAYEIFKADVYEQFRSGYEELKSNPYWKRAWVVQEVLLARNLFFLAQGSMMSVHAFKCVLTELRKSDAKEVLDLLDLLLENRPPRTTLSAKLIENIELFRHKECLNLRDRIYSILSVSSNGTQLSVDYECSLVELARSTLRIDEIDICLHRASIVLEALQINHDIYDIEAPLPVITLDGRTALRHAAPCPQCGEDTSISSPKMSTSTAMKTRYICLHCNHRGSSLIQRNHESSYQGHLCLEWGTLAEPDSDDWHLFWMPPGGGSWHKLESYKYILTNNAGSFQRLILSVGIIYELKSLIFSERVRQGEQVQRMSNNASRSSWRSTKWKVVK
jgi:hypothetical protein